MTQRTSLTLLSTSSCPTHCRMRAAAAASTHSGKQAASWLSRLPRPGFRQVKLLADSPFSLRPGAAAADCKLACTAYAMPQGLLQDGSMSEPG